MKLNNNKIPFVFAVCVGVLYGIAFHFAVRLDMFSQLHGAMSLGIIFVLPFLLGFLTLLYANENQRRSWLFRIFAPIFTASICLLISVLVGWEGAICLILGAVVYLPLASLGGIITGVILVKIERKKLNSSVLVAILSLPLFSAYTEHYFDLPIEQQLIENQIEINASADTVWEHIIRVPKITEPLSGFFYKMGFPKPVEATLSYEGVGGVREATFERGLAFIETIDIWSPKTKLSFSIKADPNSIPPTT